MKLFQAVTADEYEHDIANATTLKCLAGILQTEPLIIRRAYFEKKAIKTPYTKFMKYPAVYIVRIFV